MRRAILFLALSVMCLFASGCDPRVTVGDAKAAATDANEMMNRAASLNALGKTAEADALAISAQNGMAQARDMYLSALADKSNDTQVLTDFAALCERLRDYDLAGEAYLRAADIQRRHSKIAPGPIPVYLYSAARNFVSAGGRYLPRAAEPLDEVEKRVHGGATGVSMAEILATRGDISFKNGAYALAVERFAAAHAADPLNLRASMLFVYGAVATGDLATAGAELSKLQSQGAPVGDGTPFDARLREAYAIYKRIRPPLAESPATYRGLAGISVRLGFLGEAREAIEHALRLDDQDIFSWNMAGSLAHQAGDEQRAREAFTRSLELNPNQPRTAQALKDLTSAGAGQGPLQ